MFFGNRRQQQLCDRLFAAEATAVPCLERNKIQILAMARNSNVKLKSHTRRIFSYCEPHYIQSVCFSIKVYITIAL